MSITAKQASDIVFGDLKARIDSSPWFQTYCRPDDKIKSRLRFPKDIFALPGNSSYRAPLGYNVFSAILDEASFFETMANEAQGNVDITEEVYLALKDRRFSRFGENGLIMMISSPRYIDDFIERKYEEARSNPMIYAVRKSLWEAKPEGTYSTKTFDFEGYKVPIDFINEAKNTHKFRRDFLALPSLAVNPYMDGDKLASIMAKSELNDPVAKQDDMGYPIEFEKGWTGKPTTLYACHVDLGLTRDACGIAVGHWDSKKTECVIDLAQEIRTSKQRPLDFEAVRSIILTLKAKGFNFHVVSYDNFQSVDSRQILESKGFRVEALSVDKTTEAYDTFLAFVNQGQFDIYTSKTLLDEVKRLELINGRKVEHPPHGKKDLSDAVAGVCYWIGELRNETSEPSQAVIVNPGKSFNVRSIYQRA